MDVFSVNMKAVLRQINEMGCLWNAAVPVENRMGCSDWRPRRACQHNERVDEAPLPVPDPAASPRQRPGAKALPVIAPQRCTGCGWCVAVCEPHVLSLHTPEPGGRKRSVLHDAAACTGCALCAVRCPFGAIDMVRKTNP